MQSSSRDCLDITALFKHPEFIDVIQSALKKLLVEKTMITPDLLFLHAIYALLWFAVGCAVDWRGYHMVSPIDILLWRCSRKHGTSQPVPATLTRSLRHMDHTSRSARKTTRLRQLSKDRLPCRLSGGFQLSTVVNFKHSWSRLAGTVARLSLLESRGSSPVNPQSCDVTGPWAHEHRALLPPQCILPISFRITSLAKRESFSKTNHYKQWAYTMGCTVV